MGICADKITENWYFLSEEAWKAHILQHRRARCAYGHTCAVLFATARPLFTPLSRPLHHLRLGENTADIFFRGVLVKRAFRELRAPWRMRPSEPPPARQKNTCGVLSHKTTHAGATYCDG